MLPIAIANCFARGLELLQISSNLQVGLEALCKRGVTVELKSTLQAPLQAEVFRLNVTIILHMKFLQ